MPSVTGTPVSNQGSGSSVSVSLTVPAGATRIVVCEGGFDTTQQDCTGVAAGGNALTQIGTNVHDGGRHASMWEMRDSDANWPGTGPVTIVATNSGSRTSAHIVAFCLTDSDDVAASGAQTGTGSSATPSLTVTSASGDLVIGMFGTYSAARGAASGSDSEIDWYDGSTGDASLLVFSTPGATSTTFDWTYGSSVSYSGIAASFGDSGGGGGGGSTALIHNHLRMMKQR